MRGGWADWICPKNALERSIFGGLNRGWFMELKNSLRNCKFIPSRIVKFLNSETSQFWYPGPRIRFLPDVPKRSGAVSEKAL